MKTASMDTQAWRPAGRPIRRPPLPAAEQVALRRCQRQLVFGTLTVLCAYAGYCYLHGFVTGDTPNARVALGAALADWAVWLVVAPILAAQTFRERADAPASRVFGRVAVVGGGVLVPGAMAVRGVLDSIFTDLSIVNLLYYSLPLYVGALLVTTGVAVWSRGHQTMQSALHASAAPGPPRLEVLTPRGRHVLDAADVDYLEAGGNYIEVRSGEARYLMRTTMSRLEEQLAGSPLVRTHRSFFVNVRRVARVDHRATGNHELVLVDSTRVPVSKTYRDAFRDALRRFGGAPGHRVEHEPDDSPHLV
jgi:hypothetical protein